MEEKHQELQDQDLLGSPHLEERWIGGNVDLDLLSLFPQRYARIMGGIERKASFSKGQQWRRERGKTSSGSWGLFGGRSPLKQVPRNVTVMCRNRTQRYYRWAVVPSRYRWVPQGCSASKTSPNKPPAVLPLGQRYYRWTGFYRYKNGNNFFIRTPISMILGSLESQRGALQDHAEKHHSPDMEDKTKCRKVNLSKKRTTGKSSNIQNATQYSSRLRFV